MWIKKEVICLWTIGLEKKKYWNQRLTWKEKFSTFKKTFSSKKKKKKNSFVSCACFCWRKDNEGWTFLWQKEGESEVEVWWGRGGRVEKCCWNVWKNDVLIFSPNNHKAEFLKNKNKLLICMHIILVCIMLMRILRVKEYYLLILVCVICIIQIVLTQNINIFLGLIFRLIFILVVSLVSFLINAKRNFNNRMFSLLTNVNMLTFFISQFLHFAKVEVV